MQPIFNHPFSLIVAGPSNGGKSTLVYEIIKHSKYLVKNTDSQGFDSVWIIFRSWQPLYDEMQAELKVPVYTYEKSLPPDFRPNTRYPVVIIDDGLCSENERFVEDLFCRLGHHMSISTILIGQSLFNCKTPSLRLCHRNTKSLIIFGCPRDQASLRTLVYQMISSKKKAQLLLEAIEQELNIPYNYVLFDFQSTCPQSQRYKTNILCERENSPMTLVFPSQS